MVAFMMSSHARCGMNSPASALTSHNAPLTKLMVDKWSRGCVVICSPRFGQVKPVVGVSAHTLGATRCISEWHHNGAVTWMDNMHFLSTGMETRVTNAVTGLYDIVPDTDMFNPRLLVCSCKWIVEDRIWRVWEVTMDNYDDEDLSVSDPRSVVPWWKKAAKEPPRGTKGPQFFLSRMVGDGFCEVRKHGFPLQPQLRVYFLVDVQRAFETGEMVPVDRVSVKIPEKLGKQVDFTHCFWSSKRVVVAKSNRVYELTTSGELRFLCTHVPDGLAILDNCLLVALGRVTDQCEGDSDVHVVDPASGALIFTFMTH
ncbi:hypothetical protein Pelo_14795 [Pelomyxa schiedti]|nr:hypothetical protein Pelo_14795 [Pelomyxa schiedti]